MCILIFQWLSETQVLFAGHNFPLCRINSIICPRSRSWGWYRRLTFSAVCGSPRCGLCTLDCKQGQTIPVSINTPKRDLTGPALPDIVSKPASLVPKSGTQQENKAPQIFHKANDSGHGRPDTLQRHHNACLLRCSRLTTRHCRLRSRQSIRSLAPYSPALVADVAP